MKLELAWETKKKPRVEYVVISHERVRGRLENSIFSYVGPMLQGSEDSLLSCHYAELVRAIVGWKPLERLFANLRSPSTLLHHDVYVEWGRFLMVGESKNFLFHYAKL